MKRFVDALEQAVKNNALSGFGILLSVVAGDVIA